MYDLDVRPFIIIMLGRWTVLRCVGCVGSNEQTEAFTHNLRYGRRLVAAFMASVYNFMAQYARGASA